MFDAVAINRLAHLLRADGRDGAIGGEEVEACVFEPDPYMLEKAPDLRFGIPNEIFVQGAMHCSGKDGVEMSHQLHIIAVESSKIAQPVSTILSLRKQLREIRKAAGHGVPADIDYFGVRQGQMDEPNVRKVRAHLVGKEPALKLPVNVRSFEVSLPDAPQASSVERRKHAWIAAALLDSTLLHLP